MMNANALMEYLQQQKKKGIEELMTHPLTAVSAELCGSASEVFLSALKYAYAKGYEDALQVATATTKVLLVEKQTEDLLARAKAETKS